jgi:hypothetical protein
MKRAEEIRITKVRGGYQVTYLWGLMDTTVHPKLFASLKDARISVYNFCGNAKPAIPVVVD